MKKIDAAAAHLGVPAREIAAVDDTPAGLVITTTDGVQYVVVPEATPDAEGKTGLMFVRAPSDKYGGSFPVYAQPIDDFPVSLVSVEAALAAAALPPAAQLELEAKIAELTKERDDALAKVAELEATIAEAAKTEPPKGGKAGR